MIRSAALSFMWMGAVTFYGDSVRNQSRYFADRGIVESAPYGGRECYRRCLPALLLVAFLMT